MSDDHKLDPIAQIAANTKDKLLNLSTWGMQRVSNRWVGGCRWGNPEVLGDGTLVFPTPGHPPIDGFERQDDGRTFVPRWPECIHAVNSLGLRNKRKIVAKRNCMNPQHQLFRQLVKFGDCNNCKICILVEDVDD